MASDEPVSIQTRPERVDRPVKAFYIYHDKRKIRLWLSGTTGSSGFSRFGGNGRANRFAERIDAGSLNTGLNCPDGPTEDRWFPCKFFPQPAFKL